MTPQQLAKQECANWDNGMCFDNPCRLAENKRCTYFEEAVLPLEKHISDEAYRKSILDAADRYGKVLGGPRRRCPDCGAPLQARRRLCGDCRRKHRQQAAREAMRAKRAGC